MLARNHVKSNKGVSNLLTIMLFIALAVVVILILWNSTKKLIKSPVTDCLDLIESFSIQEVCYLNNGEIQLSLKRGFDNFLLETVRVSFVPSGSLWDISGGKCLDVKMAGRRYGGYCSIVEEGARASYVFNTTGLEKQDEIKVAVGSEKLLCVLGKKKIGSC